MSLWKYKKWIRSIIVLLWQQYCEEDKKLFVISLKKIHYSLMLLLLGSFRDLNIPIDWLVYNYLERSAALIYHNNKWLLNRIENIKKKNRNKYWIKGSRSDERLIRLSLSAQMLNSFPIQHFISTFCGECWWREIDVGRPEVSASHGR